MSSSGGIGFGGVGVPGHQEALPHGVISVRADVVARNPCSLHANPTDAQLGDLSFCPESIVGVYSNDFDASVKALAQLMQVNILALAGQSITTVSNSAQAISVADVPSAPYIVAGVTGTAPAFTDYALGDGTTNTNYHANGSYAQAGTVNAISSNTFTVTGTITNGTAGNVTYKEIGLAVTVTHSASPYYFLLCHDQVNAGTGYVVSNGGTLTVTYTGTFT